MPWWKGGWIDDSGHRRIRIDGKTISEHVYIMEQLMGRKLYPYEVVHHDNEIPDDNNPKNLIVMPRSEHIKLHNLRRIAKGGFNGSGRKSSKPNLTSEEMQQKRLEIEAKYFK
jgi:diacylglycerol kinase family enzyme